MLLEQLRDLEDQEWMEMKNLHPQGFPPRPAVPVMHADDGQFDEEYCNENMND